MKSVAAQAMTLYRHGLRLGLFLLSFIQMCFSLSEAQYETAAEWAIVLALLLGSFLDDKAS